MTAAAKLGRPLRLFWTSTEDWAERAAAWLNDDSRSLFGLLAAISAAWSIDAALEIFRDPQVLIAVIAWPLAALLLLRLDAAAPVKKAVSGGRVATLSMFVLLLGVLRIVVTLWSRAGGFFGIDETGESASIFLSSYQLRDLTSFFLQEHAASSDPAALGFFYIHHPNFISRLFTMAGIALGMTQERIILACFMVSLLSLFLGFLALRRLFSPGVAFAAIAFFATSYGIYFRQGGDLLRGLHIAMFWLLVYVTAFQAEAPLRGAKGVNIALAALFVFIASSDWAFLVFCLAFYAMWHVYATRRLDLGHLVSWVVLPVMLTFVAYDGIIIAHTGWRFFLTDALVSYFGRMGNVLSEPLLGQLWDPESFRQLYQAKHIVMWDANALPAGLAEARSAYWRAMSGGGPLVAGVTALAFVASATAMLFGVVRDRLLRGALLALWAALCLGLAPLEWVLVPIAALALALPRLRAGPAAAAPAGRGPGAIRRDLAAWVTICLSAVTLAAMVFPNYVFWLWDRGVAPVGLADAVAAALICHSLVHCDERAMWRRVAAIWPRIRTAVAPGGDTRRSAGPAAVAAISALALYHVACNYELYSAHPPRGPSYAAALRKPEFHGKLFVANTYDALVWYFTRGTSLITTMVPPDAQSTQHFRHLSDGSIGAKYSHPDYFLCDNDPYFSFQRVGKINGELCEMPKSCTCSDFMKIMSKEGDTPALVGPDYVIMKLHRAP